MVKTRNITLFIISYVLILSTVLYTTAVLGTRVSALSPACQNSAACREAAAEEERANTASAEASAAADSYAQAVAYKNAEIAQKRSLIAQARANIDALIAEITAAEAKLTRQQNNLAVLLIDMYFSKDSDPVLMLAGSTTISELAEKEARESTARDQIDRANSEIKTLKSQLEEKKLAQEANLAALEVAEAELRTAKAELEALVAKYSEDASAYSAEAAAARERKIAAERKEQEDHPELYHVGSYYGATNSYEWQDKCPEQQDWDYSYHNGRIIGGFLCECVSYAAWKVFETYGIYITNWGNASTWSYYASISGYRVDGTPTPGSVGAVGGGPYGHVIWVENVYPDGSIDVSEYNNMYSTCLYQTGGNVNYCSYSYWNYPTGEFGARRMTAWEAAEYSYIHFR